MNEKTHVIHRSLCEKMEMEAVLKGQRKRGDDDDDDDAKKKKKKKKKKGENQSRIIARLDSRMMLSSKKSGRLALGGDTGTFGERKTRRMSTPAPSCPDERWVYSSAFAEEEGRDASEDAAREEKELRVREWWRRCLEEDTSGESRGICRRDSRLVPTKQERYRAGGRRDEDETSGEETVDVRIDDA